MDDARALRANLELRQVQLSAARAQLALPLDASDFAAAAADKLAALRAERADLISSLRGIGGLEQAAEETRLWSLERKTVSPTADLSISFQLVGMLVLLAVAGWGGIHLGHLLAKHGVPWPAGAGLYTLAVAVIAADLIWFDALWRDLTKGRNTAVLLMAILAILSILGLSAYYGVGQYVARSRITSARAQTPIDDVGPDRDAAALAMREQRAGLHGCWVRLGNDTPKIEVAFTLGLMGEVLAPRVTAAGAPMQPAAGGCFLEWTQSLKLPAPRLGPLRIEWVFANPGRPTSPP